MEKAKSRKQRKKHQENEIRNRKNQGKEHQQ